jgi:LmbE family N-acetylglucosaminyl deacetylase
MMRLRIIAAVIFFAAALPAVSYATKDAPAPRAIVDIRPSTKNDRILIFAPHPDDETIGCAGIIQQALSQGAAVNVVYLTNGDSNELSFIVYEKRLTFRKQEFIHMGEVRRNEAVAAMNSLGLDSKGLIFLGYPDFGCFGLFMSYWGDSRPYTSLLTRVRSVPYAEDFSFGAPYKGESVLRDLTAIIKKFRPTRIFVSHPADTNGDHKALYLFLQIALADVYKDSKPAPQVYPYLVHCVGWPTPRRYHPELPLYPPEKFLDSQINWVQYRLSAQQLEKKHQLVLRYKSQTESSGFYLLAFARQDELFGDYPDITLALSGPSGAASPVALVGPSAIFTDNEVGPIAELDELLQGKGYVTYGIDGENLVVNIHEAKRVHRSVGVMLYLFGYRHDRAFSAMPKIRVMAKAKQCRVFNGRKKINPGGITASFTRNDVVFRLPLAVLGQPDFILSSMRMYAGIVPVDTVSFRKIVLRRGHD